MSTMRQSDVAHTFMLRMQVIEKYFLIYNVDSFFMVRLVCVHCVIINLPGN